MIGCNRGLGLAMMALTLALAAPARAQENLDSGKTGAQLYAANCTACHKSPQALNKSGGMFGLSGFLREHYTSSRESASAIASYLESLSPPPGKRTGAAKRAPKGDEKAKAGEKPGKSSDAKSEKPGKTAKPDKVSEPKSSEPKTEPKVEPKVEPKSKPKRESKSTETKSTATKPADAKTSKPKEAAPAAKTDKPD